nr:MAK10-like protein [Tanacetum cinerariifolium]
MGDENLICTLKDCYKPSQEGYMNTIEIPVGNNVVPLRSDTIRLVQNGCSFYGLRSEDPSQHLKDFYKLVDHLTLMVKIGKEHACIYFNSPFAIKLAIGLNNFKQIDHHMGGSYYLIPCSIISTRKDRKTPQRYLDVPTTPWRIFIR